MKWKKSILQRQRAKDPNSGYIADIVPWTEATLPHARKNGVRMLTDAGGEGLKGTVTFVSPRAEFTPRNVQTADERSKLVYRIKVSVDNTSGVLKAGMPVEAEIPLQATPK